VELSFSLRATFPELIPRPFGIARPPIRLKFFCRHVEVSCGLPSRFILVTVDDITASLFSSPPPPLPQSSFRQSHYRPELFSLRDSPPFSFLKISSFDPYFTVCSFSSISNARLRCLRRVFRPFCCFKSPSTLLFFYFTASRFQTLPITVRLLSPDGLPFYLAIGCPNFPQVHLPFILARCKGRIELARQFFCRT